MKVVKGADVPVENFLLGGLVVHGDESRYLYYYRIRNFFMSEGE